MFPGQPILSSGVLQSGAEQPLTSPLSLQAGPLTLLFDSNLALLRYVRLGDHEVVRGITGAVRDRDWNTVPPKTSNLEVARQPDSFQLSCDVECRAGDIDFLWHATVTGTAEGEITFQFKGTARSSFLRNRIGLYVLHPLTECVGKPCRVENPAGQVEVLSWPEAVAATQPFLNVRALRYEPAPGQQVEVRFTGEVFETEDHRNWTDASFKTYSTPLELPLPVLVETGTVIEQQVRVTLLPPFRKILPVLLGRQAQLSIATTPVVSKPPVGLVLQPAAEPLFGQAINRFKALDLAHLRVDLDLSSSAWTDGFQRATTTAAQIGTGLHVALTLSSRAETELAAFREVFQMLRPPVRLWIVFDQSQAVTPETLLHLARPVLQELAPNILLAGGTKGWFDELNRARPGPSYPGMVCYTITPQVHAFDNTSLVESLGGQTGAVQTARQFSVRPVVISPITLRPQPSPGDPRQRSLLGGAWTLGSFARLALTGNIHSLTYYEMVGSLGVMDGSGVFPIYHVFADMAGYGRLYATHSTHPLQVEGLTLVDAQNRRRVLVANLLGEPQEVKIKSGSGQAQVRYLDDTNALLATTDPETFRSMPRLTCSAVTGKIELHLRPYALARVDLDGLP